MFNSQHIYSFGQIQTSMWVISGIGVATQLSVPIHHHQHLDHASPCLLKLVHSSRASQRPGRDLREVWEIFENEKSERRRENFWKNLFHIRNLGTKTFFRVLSPETKWIEHLMLKLDKQPNTHLLVEVCIQWVVYPPSQSAMPYWKQEMASRWWHRSVCLLLTIDEHGGCRHNSVDSSAPSILLPRVRIPSTPSTLLSI